MIHFPKWKYHALKEAKIVHTEIEEKALGPDWVDSPADVEAKKVAFKGPTDKPKTTEKPK